MNEPTGDFFRRITAPVAAVLVLASAVPSFSRENGKDRKSVVLPSRDRALMIAQSGDRVVLQWSSEKGKYYTLMFTDELYTDREQGRARWSPLPGYIRMPGSGNKETREFQIDPAHPRRYNLHVETEEQVRAAEKAAKK
jgi:hypothetical protein